MLPACQGVGKVVYLKMSTGSISPGPRAKSRDFARYTRQHQTSTHLPPSLDNDNGSSNSINNQHRGRRPVSANYHDNDDDERGSEGECYGENGPKRRVWRRLGPR
jgi:hypothetical protein